MGHGLIGHRHGLCSVGFLTPVAGALTQEAIDVAVILNALRALAPRPDLQRARFLPRWHKHFITSMRYYRAELLDQLRSIADALDDHARSRDRKSHRQSTYDC